MNPYAFTPAQLVDLRRYTGYPAFGDGSVVLPMPWVMKYYAVLEYKLAHTSPSEGAVVVGMLATLNTLEAAIPNAGANLDTDSAAVWVHNKNEVRDRARLFDYWRARLCDFYGVPPGPNFGTNANAASVALVV